MRNKHLYPANWDYISSKHRVEVAKNRCEFCGVPHGAVHPSRGYTIYLQCAHLDHNRENITDENLRSLCPACHLNHDREENMRVRKTNAARSLLSPHVK